MKKYLFFVMLMTSITLVLTACVTNQHNEAQVEEKEELPVHTIGLIDEIEANRILITVKQSPFGQDRKGERMYFNIDALSSNTIKQLKRSQVVDIIHGPAVGLSFPPVGVAEQLVLVDEGLSKTPHVTVFTLDDNEQTLVRSHDLIGTDVTNLDTLLQPLIWQQGSPSFEEILHAFTFNATTHDFERDTVQVGYDANRNIVLARYKSNQYTTITKEQFEELQRLLFPQAA